MAIQIDKTDIVEVDVLVTQLEEFKKITSVYELYNKPINIYLSNRAFKDMTDKFAKKLKMDGMQFLKMVATDMDEANTALDRIADELSSTKNGVILFDTITIRQDGILKYTPFLLKYIENLYDIFEQYVNFVTGDEYNEKLLERYIDIYKNGVKVVKADGSIKNTVNEILHLPKKQLSTGEEGFVSSVLKAILSATHFLIGKPIFFFMKWWADYQYTKYLKAKERAEYLTMKIDELERKFTGDGKPMTVKEKKIIEYYQDMLDAARKEMADYEEEIREDMENAN